MGLEVVAPRLRSTGSAVVVHGLSCSMACEIFPDQGLNPPCLLHWKADSSPLSHQGGLNSLLLMEVGLVVSRGGVTSGSCGRMCLACLNDATG